MRQERAGQSPGLRKEWSLPSTGATEEGEDRHPRTRERGRGTEAGSSFHFSDLQTVGQFETMNLQGYLCRVGRQQ